MTERLHVLLVEDNPGDADLILEMLPMVGAGAFEVVRAQRLSTALERAGAARFDVILLDLGLPDSDGLETLRVMRRHAADLPIVLLTGNSDEQTGLAAVRQGAQDYLIKGQINTNLLTRSITYAVERKKAEEKLLRLNRLYSVLSAINHAIVHTGDRDALFRDFCRVAVRLGGFRLAWVGLVDPETGAVNIVAADGETAYLDGIRVSVNQEPEGMGPTGTTIREGRSYICNDFFSTSITKPWQGRARAHGLFSSASIAIRNDQQVIGALTLYAAAKDIFDTQQVELLERLGDDISFALDNLVLKDRVREAEVQARIAGERERAAVALRQSEELLRQSEEQYHTLFNTLIEGFCTIDIVFDADGRPLDCRLLETNAAFARQTGLQNAQGRRMRELVPDCEQYWFDIFGNVATTGESVRLENEVKALGRIFDVCAYRMGGPESRRVAVLFNDITERKRTERLLQASLQEKETLLKEIHHRVKNNLQVISSLVNLQSEAIDDPGLWGYLRDIRDRVRSMALVHEKLYQSEDLACVPFDSYVGSLLNYLGRAYTTSGTAVRLTMDLQPVRLSVEKAVPCGLILNELFTNAFKHAFRGRSQGEITTVLHTDADGTIRLRVGDDGVGLPPGLDWRRSRSLGLRLVQMLAGQLNATLELDRDGGTAFEISFRLPETVDQVEKMHG